MDLRLKPQDIVVALKLVAQGNAEWTQPELARSLHLSASEVNHRQTSNPFSRSAIAGWMCPKEEAG